MADTNQKIRKQVNFYLSDSNLPYDKYLWTLREETPEGWIPIETIASFKRMKMFTDDLETVVKALKEEESDLYELDAEDKKIRRKSPVVEQDHVSRSIHVKGFPLVDVDAADPALELFKLQDKADELFSQYGTVLCTRFKKTHERPSKFKGTAYVEFSTPEEAKKAAEAKELDFEGNKLELLYRPEYHNLKAEEYKDKPQDGKKRFSFNAFKPRFQHNNNKNNNNNNKYNSKRKFNGKHKNGGDAKKTKTEDNVKAETDAVEAKTEVKDEVKAEVKDEVKAE